SARLQRRAGQAPRTRRRRRLRGHAGQGGRGMEVRAPGHRHGRKQLQGAPMSEITQLPAGEIARRVGARELRAREVAEAFLARIERLNPAINAVCTLNPRALEEADAIDARLATGERARPLEGAPFLAKDI